jgi:hypothetical protein
MSHFTVLVLGDNPIEQLAPFQENNMGDCPAKYLEFRDDEDEHLSAYNTETSERVQMPDGRLLLTFDEEFEVKGDSLFDRKHVVPAGLVKREVPFKEIYPTFEAYMEGYCGYSARDARTGRYGHWSNPNSKWDWYQLGGRWSGFFKLRPYAVGLAGKPGLMTEPAPEGYVDQAFKRVIDFAAMRAEAAAAAGARYDRVVGLYGGPLEPLELEWKALLEDASMSIEAKRAAYHAQPQIVRWNAAAKKDPEHAVFGFFTQYEEFAIPREVFVKRAADGAATTHAVIKDGRWYERGDMGWWGCIANEKDADRWNQEFAKLLDEAPDTTLMSVFDCHV